MPITDIYLRPVGAKRQRILSYHIDFDQRIDDRTGRPVGRPVLTQFSSVISRDSAVDEPFFIDWMLDPTKQVTLKISFYNNNKLVREISIDDAYLVSYKQNMEVPGTILETLVFSPETLKIDTVPFDRKDAM